VSFSKRRMSQPVLNAGDTLRRRSSTISHVLWRSLGFPPVMTFHPSAVTFMSYFSPSRVVSVTTLFGDKRTDLKREEYVDWRCSCSCVVSNDVCSGVNSGRGIVKDDETIDENRRNEGYVLF
jgi:hypothetical protein